MELTQKTIDYLMTIGVDMLAAIAILVLGWLVASLSERIIRKRAQYSRVVDATLAIMLAKISRTLILAVTAIAVLNQFGIQTTSLIALLGAAGLAIGLALQGALSNVAAGIMLLVLRPFRVGDLVEFGSTLGTVDEIGLFVTSMRTPDNIGMVVPNSQVWGNSIRNYSANDTRRLDMTFSIDYSDDMDKATAIIKSLIEADERFLKEPEPLVAVAELADSAINLYVRPWVRRENVLAARLDLTKRVKERFDAEGISIPFPQQEVRMYQMPAKAA